MTREEALYQVKGYLTDIIPTEDYSEVEEIIKALEQETCDDAISRQAVLEQIDQWSIGSRECLYTNATYYLTRRIQDLPPVTPQPKMGKWITTRTFMHDGEYYCDKCKCDAPYNEKWDYCPNCGVKMESEG